MAGEWLKANGRTFFTGDPSLAEGRFSAAAGGRSPRGRGFSPRAVLWRASIRNRLAAEPHAALRLRIAAAVAIDVAGFSGGTAQAAADGAGAAAALAPGGAICLELPAGGRWRADAAAAFVTRGPAGDASAAIGLADASGTLDQPRAAGRAGGGSRAVRAAACACVAHFGASTGGTCAACRATGRRVINVAGVGLAAARRTAGSVADALAIDADQAIATRVAGGHGIRDTLARDRIAGLANGAGATVTRPTIDALLAVVEHRSARAAAGLGDGLRTTLLRALAIPAPALAMLVPLHAPLAPPAACLCVARIHDARQPSQDRQHRQPGEETAAGIASSQGASQGIEVAIVHGGLSVVAHGKAGGRTCAGSISWCDIYR